MNQNTPDSDDAGLSRALREWKVEAPLPPRFGEQVWRRIESRGEPGSVWALLSRGLAAAFARPALAGAYVAVLLFAGAAAGYWQARSARDRSGEMLSARYVEMVDPSQRMGH